MLHVRQVLFSHWWEQLEHPHRVWDQDFGSNLHPEELTNPALTDPQYSVLRALRHPLQYLAACGNHLRKRIGAGSSTVDPDKDKLKVVLDIQLFRPDEINVKVVDRIVIISAEHGEELDGHCWVSRKFVRKYLLPEQYDIDEVNSNISSNGALIITAPRKDLPKLENARHVKIQHTRKPAFHWSVHHNK